MQSKNHAMQWLFACAATNWYNYSMCATTINSWIDNLNHCTKLYKTSAQFALEWGSSALCSLNWYFIAIPQLSGAVFGSEIICTNHNFENIHFSKNKTLFNCILFLFELFLISLLVYWWNDSLFQQNFPQTFDFSLTRRLSIEISWNSVITISWIKTDCCCTPSKYYAWFPAMVHYTVLCFLIEHQQYSYSWPTPNFIIDCTRNGLAR